MVRKTAVVWMQPINPTVTKAVSVQVNQTVLRKIPRQQKSIFSGFWAPKVILIWINKDIHKRHRDTNQEVAYIVNILCRQFGCRHPFLGAEQVQQLDTGYSGSAGFCAGGYSQICWADEYWHSQMFQALEARRAITRTQTAELQEWLANTSSTRTEKLSMQMEELWEIPEFSATRTTSLWNHTFSYNFLFCHSSNSRTSRRRLHCWKYKRQND